MADYTLSPNQLERFVEFHPNDAKVIIRDGDGTIVYKNSDNPQPEFMVGSKARCFVCGNLIRFDGEAWEHLNVLANDHTAQLTEFPPGSVSGAEGIRADRELIREADGLETSADGQYSVRPVGTRRVCGKCCTPIEWDGCQWIHINPYTDSRCARGEFAQSQFLRHSTPASLT